jgi:hypothetical protein
MLIWVEDCPGRGTPEWVDDYITAELPDMPPADATGEAADMQRRGRHLMASLMVHTHSANSSCMIDGKCKRFFPKQFSERTHLNVNRFPHYLRRAPVPDNVINAAAAESAEVDPDETVIYRRRPPPSRIRTVPLPPEELW